MEERRANEEATSPAVPITARRRWLFALLAIALAWAAIEGGTLVLLAASGRSLSEISAARRLASDVADVADEEAIPMQLRRPGKPAELHPYFGVHSLPGGPNLPADAELARFGFPVNLRERLFYEPSPERVVVGIFGGSVASIAAVGGTGLETVLRSVHRFAGKEIVLLSFADGAFKQPQQWLILSYLLSLGTHLDVVVDLDGFNEMVLPERNRLQGLPPQYPWGWGEVAGGLEPGRLPIVGRLSLLRERRQRLAEIFSHPLLRFSPSAGVLWLALNRSMQARIESASSKLAGTNEEKAGSGPMGGPTSSRVPPRELADLWRDSSRLMAELCGARGIEFHHLLQPNQYFSDTKPLAAERAAGVFAERHPYAALAREGYAELLRAGRELRAAGAPFHDLSRLFATRSELLYGDSCCHLNFRGNLLLQRAIAEQLAGRPFAHPENLTDGGLALAGFDPVSYFDGEPSRGRPELASKVDGIVYWHRDAASRQRFLAEPDRYRPQLGGWCAFGLGMDARGDDLPPGRYPVDPEHWEIYDGRLYLFLRTKTFDTRELWRTDPARYIAAAQERWERLRHVPLDAEGRAPDG